MKTIITIFFIFFSILSLTLGLSTRDHEALLAIKSKISNDPTSMLSSWNNSLHFCRWEGVTCGLRHRRVVLLDLSGRNLVGTLSPFVGNLSFLRDLKLVSNSFHGPIPHQISYLGRLQILNLTLNLFEGVIPASLSHCSRLIELDLRKNKLSGRIPAELASLPNLRLLALSGNTLSGRLQDIGIGNMSTSLKALSLFDNLLHGSIPNEIGRLKSLVFLDIGNNMLSGAIPDSLYNLSSLEVLFLGNTNLHGHIRHDIDLRLPRLRRILMWDMSLVGQVPTSLSNLSNLYDLDISLNNFTGKFSFNGRNLPHLSFINIESSYSVSAGDFSFLDTLTNCTNLGSLLLGGNSFIGPFPHSVPNLSTSLYELDLWSNQISGQLPPGLGKFVNLYVLDLHDNHFTGLIPSDLSTLEKMQLLYLDNNNFIGQIPYSLENLTFLSTLSLTYNILDGLVPKNLGNSRFLQRLYLSSNNLSGVLPIELFKATSLLELSIDQNNFHGSLPPEIGKLEHLVMLDVSHNKFSGEIPSALGGCTSLTFLSANGNSFVGSIPATLNPLKDIQYLDLSCNSLSGQIPSYFLTWPYLKGLNLSFNRLEGEVPVNGVFSNTSAVSVVGNSKLCGGVPELHLPRCHSFKESKRRPLSLAMVVIISVVCGLVIVLSLALGYYVRCYPRKKEDSSSELQMIRPFLEVSYQMLSRATTDFSSSNLLGRGSFGSVYKGTLYQDGAPMEVAVKVMNHQNKGASKSFVAECNALRHIRHRNLVKIITTCSSIDPQRNHFKALVYEFIPRGSLESWLHPHLSASENGGDGRACSLGLFQRLSIALDVATALEYLHIECADPIIHCDLKPSNILLDDEMTARVSDFGLAKFLLLGPSTSNTENPSSSTQVRGTVGYAAPEYGLGSNVSTEGDVYSYGVVVLEMMTSKKPTDPMFCDGLNLHAYARSALPNQVMRIIDERMLGDSMAMPARNNDHTRKIECIKSLVMIGVQCSLEVPQERMSIRDVVNELKSAMQNLLR